MSTCLEAMRLLVQPVSSPPTCPAYSHQPAHPVLQLQEYGYLPCALMQLSTLGVQGLPCGPLALCPCCSIAGSDYPLHINIDFNFNLTHLSSCGSSSARQPPPNQQLFLPGTDVEQLLQAGGSAAAAAEAERAPTLTQHEGLGARLTRFAHLPESLPALLPHRPPPLHKQFCPDVALAGASSTCTQLVTLIAEMATQYDITGVGSIMCRHSVVAQL